MKKLAVCSFILTLSVFAWGQSQVDKDITSLPQTTFNGNEAVELRLDHAKANEPAPLFGYGQGYHLEYVQQGTPQSIRPSLKESSKWGFNATDGLRPRTESDLFSGAITMGLLNHFNNRESRKLKKLEGTPRK